MQPRLLPSDRFSFPSRSKERDPTDGSGGTDGAMTLLPKRAAPASPQGAAEPLVGLILLSWQCGNLIQPGRRRAGGWCEPPSSSKSGTCTFALITRCPAIRSRQRRAAVMGDSTGGSHRRPQLMSRTVSGARRETTAAELPKARQKPPWEGAALGDTMGSLREPSAAREQHWHQPWPPTAANGHSHPLLSHGGSLSCSDTTTHVCCWDMFCRVHH